MNNKKNLIINSINKLKLEFNSILICLSISFNLNRIRTDFLSMVLIHIDSLF